MDRDLASRQEARELLARTRRAFEAFKHFDQGRVDSICAAMVEAGFAASKRLAEVAVEETGIGCVDGKTRKNEFATRDLWAAIADLKTCDLIRSDDVLRVYEYADPFGVVASIIPTTNPTSTALFKCIIAVKSRNGTVVSPHPRAVNCIAESVRVVHDAAVAAGAPVDLVTCMQTVTLDGTDELMKNPGTDLILATGGSALVRAAYSSGKPAFGVGPGNSPAYVDRSADVAAAAQAVIDSQTFDNSTICASEQSLVLDRPIRDSFLEEMKRRGAHHCSSAEAALLGPLMMKGLGMNPDVVGLYPNIIARMAGFEVPETTTVLLADCDGVGPEYALSIEKLCPVLSVFTADGWERGCERCLEVLAYGGMGHTLAIHCGDDSIAHEFARLKPVNRIVVNSPGAQGSVGATTNLMPSMTLGCGSFGGNITSDNIGPLHLINVKRLAWVKTDQPVAASDVAPTSTSPWSARGLPAGGAPDPAKQLWKPEPTRDFGPPDPDSFFSSDDLEQIIAGALSRRRDDGCPFGRCADCPPSGQTCSKGYASR